MFCSTFISEINAPCWHVLMILPFLDWDIRESFRKEKAWLKSANWNKIFAYNRDMASAWAIHSFKTEMQAYTILQTSPYLWNLMFPLIMSNDLFTTFWQLGLVFHIAFPTCLILRLQNSLWKLMELSMCQSSLTQSCLERGLLARRMPHSSIDEEEHCLVGVNMVSCHF